VPLRKRGAALTKGGTIDRVAEPDEAFGLSEWSKINLSFHPLWRKILVRRVN